ncbi:helix-turn-helix domain-containing protein [Glycomyces lechevalierae]|nr:helix-turn-helix transcriptional regulator [Glycomyces lechevalierae]
MSSQFGTPTLAKVALGNLLVSIREAAGLTPTEVADALGIYPETLRRWERGLVAPGKMKLESLAKAIRATPEQLSRMNSLSLAVRQRGMFEGNNVAPNARVLYESEATASIIESIGLEFLPGLTQTPEYHRIAQEAQLPMDEERAASLRALRARRQKIIFSRKPLPRMHFLIGPAALLYLDAYPEMRGEQIERLLEIDAMPGCEVRVIRGLHAAMLGSFTRLSLPDTRPLVYVESIDGVRYIEGAVVSEFRATFKLVQEEQSVPIQEVVG